MHKLSRLIVLLTGIFLFAAQAFFAQEKSSPNIQTEARLLEMSRPVERELKGGETHSYKIALEKGQFLNAAVNQRGIDVVVIVFAPDDTKIAEVDSPNGNEGDEPVALEAGTTGSYRIEIISLEKDDPTGRYEIRVNEILSAAQYAARLAEEKRKQQAVVKWLKDTLIPIKTVEAGNDFADLQPLKRILKDVRFVGLGEETHGTREFFQFKHRMLEFLVREMGFRVFAIEASYSACQNINDYIMGKSGDGAKALDSQGFWTWNTEEVRRMIDWMREYNKTVSEDKKIKFTGFDIQYNQTGKSRLLEYLKRVAPGRVAETETLFNAGFEESAYALFSEKGDKAKAALIRLAELRKEYDDLFVFLELNEANLVAASSRAEYEQMREFARVLTQFTDSYSRIDQSGLATRDLYMADNFRRLVNSEPAGTKFVVWAHNGHISTDDENGFNPHFGWHLRRFYGKDYYALGFSFNQGAFQARGNVPNEPPENKLREWTIPPAPENSIDWYLAQTGAKSFITDFRSVRQTTESGEWLKTPRRMRSIGSGFASNFDESSYAVEAPLNKEFDGLFFINTTTRARPNPSVRNVAKTQ